MKNQKTKSILAAFAMLMAALLTMNAAAQWQQTSGPYELVIYSIASDGNNIYAAAQNPGKIYLSDDDGMNWTSINNGLPTSNFLINNICAIGQKIYLGTNKGLYISANNGANWTTSNYGFMTSVSVFAIAKAGTNFVAGTNQGIYLSTDDCATWALMNNGLTTTNVRSFAVVGSTIFAGTYGGGVFISADTAATWAAKGLAGKYVLTFAINGADIFAGTTSGVYKTTDNGVTWTTMNSGLSTVNTKTIIINGTDMFAATSGGVFYSANYATNWTKVNNGLTNTNITCLTAKGSDIFAGTTLKGIFRTTDNGTNWSTVNNGISRTYFSIPSIVSIGSTIFGAATYDGIMATYDHGQNWSTTGYTSNPGVNVLKINGTDFFAGTSNGVALSTDSGATWTWLTLGLTSAVQQIAISGQYIYAVSDYSIYLSTNYGGNWFPVNTGLPVSPIKSLAFCGSNIFAGTEGKGVYYSSNNGANWLPANTNISSKKVRALLVDGTDIYAGTYGNGIYKSGNNGTTWTQINNGLTNTKINTLTKIGSVLIAGADSGGVFASMNNGSTWLADNNGMLNSTNVLSYAVNGSYIFAGTSSNSVWRCSLSDFNFYSYTGNIFNDKNNNGIKDLNETGINNMLIRTKANNLVTNTDAGGNFNIFSAFWGDTLEVIQNYPYYTINPQYYTVYASDTGKNFAVHFIPDIVDVRVTVCNLTPARVGFNDVIRVTYENIGTDTVDGTVTLGFDSGINFLSSSPAETNVTYNQVSWDYTSLKPFEKRDIDVIFKVPVTVSLGSVLVYSGTIYPVTGDTMTYNNYNNIEQVVTGSFDPNEKEVGPYNYFLPQQLLTDDKVFYTIHFQNTGTDTAFNIRIVDTLSSSLDYTTFELLSSSHPCTYTMHGPGVVEFYFPNILLPDSNVNFVGSNGFVKFSIKPDSTLTLGDSINNTSYIYFDFNFPVKTNVTCLNIGKPMGLENNFFSKESYNDMMVFPNPVFATLTVQIENPDKNSVCKVYNVLGTEVINKTFTGNKFNLDVSKLSKGLYLLKVESEEGAIMKKFIKE